MSRAVPNPTLAEPPSPGRFEDVGSGSGRKLGLYISANGGFQVAPERLAVTNFCSLVLRLKLADAVEKVGSCNFLSMR